MGEEYPLIIHGLKNINPSINQWIRSNSLI